ncbi:hypothetical protein PC129_g21562 [Phytophthora cactorum]|uniref:Uncharacterized protein n=1 Tax=Phytophthora cactorum TaxID=29920 RepID=A0A8T1EUE2_9STRA|nr:hypothetical protein PC112_g22434 [Phytophthora cactorum]KAG2796460.1 hypothetical protein PC111_g21713 [Phytophthora cactorum]KAG2824019.1 hypothetical protein PC113_g22096 [Phytophthora cactorum]KAG2881488.1 hypothetical protein PC115_g22217 [Phytophthora cactorum]KAG2961254.1 hypothetical protein PC118_g22069 [Phytophthora cactorum]
MTDLLNAEENDAGRKVPDEMTEGTPTRSANNEDVRAKGGETAEGEGNASSDGVPAGENVPVGASSSRRMNKKRTSRNAPRLLRRLLAIFGWTLRVYSGAGPDSVDASFEGVPAS